MDSAPSNAALQTARYDDLLDAAVRGNVADVRRALSRGTSPNAQPSAAVRSRFFTASREGGAESAAAADSVLWLACQAAAATRRASSSGLLALEGLGGRRDRMGVVKALIRGGATCDVARGGVSLLSAVVAQGDRELATLLLSGGAASSSSSSSSSAARARRADPNWIPQARGDARDRPTAASAAMASSRKTCGAGEPALLAAVQNADEAMVDLLLRHGADVNACGIAWGDAAPVAGWTALMWACAVPSVPIATLLVRRGADVNAWTTVPPPHLAEQDPEDEDELLLPGEHALVVAPPLELPRPPPAAPGAGQHLVAQSAAKIALREGCTELVALLLARGADALGCVRLASPPQTRALSDEERCDAAETMNALNRHPTLVHLVADRGGLFSGSEREKEEEDDRTATVRANTMRLMFHLAQPALRDLPLSKTTMIPCPASLMPGAAALRRVGCDAWCDGGGARLAARVDFRCDTAYLAGKEMVGKEIAVRLRATVHLDGDFEPCRCDGDRTFVRGTRVVVVGDGEELGEEQQRSWPKGAVGVVASALGAERNGRYRVRFKGTAKGKLLRPMHVRATAQRGRAVLAGHAVDRIASLTLHGFPRGSAEVDSHPEGDVDGTYVFDSAATQRMNKERFGGGFPVFSRFIDGIALLHILCTADGTWGLVGSKQEEEEEEKSGGGGGTGSRDVEALLLATTKSSTPLGLAWQIATRVGDAESWSVAPDIVVTAAAYVGEAGGSKGSCAALPHTLFARPTLGGEGGGCSEVPPWQRESRGSSTSERAICATIQEAVDRKWSWRDGVVAEYCAASNEHRVVLHDCSSERRRTTLWLPLHHIRFVDWSVLPRRRAAIVRRRLMATLLLLFNRLKEGRVVGEPAVCDAAHRAPRGTPVLRLMLRAAFAVPHREGRNLGVTFARHVWPSVLAPPP